MLLQHKVKAVGSQDQFLCGRRQCVEDVNMYCVVVFSLFDDVKLCGGFARHHDAEWAYRVCVQVLKWSFAWHDDMPLTWSYSWCRRQHKLEVQHIFHCCLSPRSVKKSVIFERSVKKTHLIWSEGLYKTNLVFLQWTFKRPCCIQLSPNAFVPWDASEGRFTNTCINNVRAYLQM